MLRIYPLSDAATDHFEAVAYSATEARNDLLVDSMNLSDKWELATPLRAIAGSVSDVDEPVRCPSEGVVFAHLIREWHRERGFTSAVDDIAACPSYQRIIGVGPDVLPAIFAQLRLEGDDPDHWFPALEAITGANPVPESDFGNLAKMADAWLGWAMDQDVY